jgi:glutamate--cysteine ligase catalytic subunit
LKVKKKSKNIIIILNIFKIPIYSDKLTQIPEIHMDAMAFGMGCCCLQATYSCTTLSQARYFYDQFAILSPLLLAFSASSPIFNGYLSDIDTRWTVISQSVDCRNSNERNPKHPNYKPKSRYDSISYFINESSHKFFDATYNDL